MPSNIPPFGVPIVSVAQTDSASALGSFAAATMVCSEITPTTYNRGSVHAPIGGSGSWKVLIAPMGVDLVNGGYTFGIPTAASSAQVPTSGQGILARLAASNWGSLTNVGESIALAIFLQKGSANPQLASYGIVDTATDFSFLIMEQPLAQNIFFTAAELATPPGSPNPNAGSRAPYGVLYQALTPTTRGVRFIHKVTKVNYSPDNSVDSQIRTAAATDLQFNVLNADIPTLMGSLGGNYVLYTDTNSDVVQQGACDLYTTAANVIGNQAISVLMPPKAGKNAVKRLHVGNVTHSQDEFTEEFQKTESPFTPYTLSAASFDPLLIPMMTGIFLERN